MRRVRLVTVMIFLGVLFAPPTAVASGVPFKVGDVFAGIGNGKIGHYSPAGTRLDTLDSGTNSLETAGMAFDDAGNLYGTDFQANAVSKYDPSGNLLGQLTGLRILSR